MKKYVLKDSAGLSSLASVEVEVPTVGPGQVLLRIKAVSLNYRDIMISSGKYGADLRYPLIPISDGAGSIEAIGDGVSRVKVGDRVCGIFMQKWLSGDYKAEYGASSLGGQSDGMLRDYIVLSEDGVIPFPEHLTVEEASTLPCAAVTAWNALYERSVVLPGQKVLVQGTGGVSIFALQFAALTGAEVYVTSSSDEKLEKAKQLGAHVTVNYSKTPEWHDEVLRITQKRGVDHVVEVGGAGTFERSMKVICPGGTVSIIGILSGTGTSVPLMDFIRKVARVNGIYVGSREMFEKMNRCIESAKLKPIVDRIFPVSEIQDAYQYQIAGKHFGKVVVRLDE